MKNLNIKVQKIKRIFFCKFVKIIIQILVDFGLQIISFSNKK